MPKTAHSTRGGATPAQCRVGQSPLSDLLVASSPLLHVLGDWKGLMELCSASHALFDGLVQQKCETSVSACVFFQLEVSQLEGSLQQPKAQSAMSPYLVPDTQALCQHLAVVKQLATSGRFIIIIPRTGMGTPRQITEPAFPSFPPCWKASPVGQGGGFLSCCRCPLLQLQQLKNRFQMPLLGGCFMCGPCLECNMVCRRTSGKREALFTLCLLWQPLLPCVRDSSVG